MKIRNIDCNIVFGLNCKKSSGNVKKISNKVTSIEDFFIDKKPTVIPANIEKSIDRFIEKYSQTVDRRTAEAIEASKHIYLNI